MIVATTIRWLVTGQLLTSFGAVLVLSLSKDRLPSADIHFVDPFKYANSITNAAAGRSRWSDAGLNVLVRGAGDFIFEPLRDYLPVEKYEQSAFESTVSMAKKYGFSDFYDFFRKNRGKSIIDYAVYKGYETFAKTYETFLQKFNKSYSNDELPVRQLMLLVAQRDINQTNSTLSFSLGFTSLADQTEEEYNMRQGVVIPVNEGRPLNKTISRPKRSVRPLPEEFDWRSREVVLEPVDQGKCMTCWAFATVATIESRWAIKNGKQKLSRLSPQQLFDCVVRAKTCNDGFWPKGAFEYAVSQQDGKLASWKSYEYDSRNPKKGSCQKVKDNPIKFTSFGSLPPGTSDDRIMEAIYDQGPLTAVMNFGAFKLYKNGIVDEKCEDSNTHAVTIIGWGKDKKLSKDYWIIKNSFGTEWGEDGYMRVSRGEEICMFNKRITFPIV